ncbi:MAG: LysR family transcriptional regulator [Agarilytica sp.]
MISIKQLNYALAVEKTLHFKKAAELCHVSQSALSTALNELEKHLGLQIFERDNKKVLVTPVGAEVLEKARNIFVQVKELEQLSEGQNTPLSFPITMGVIPTVAPYLLPLLFPILNSEYPDAQVNIVEAQSHNLVEMVRKGEIDTAVLALPFPLDGLLSFEFWQEDFFWVALKGEKFTQQNEITSDEIHQSNVMLLTEGHCLKDHILDACKFDSQTANHGFGAASLNTLIQMVMGKIGTTLIPEMALQQLTSQNDALTAVHLKEKGPHRRIAFIVRPNYTRLDNIEVLKDICHRALEENSLH